MRGRLSALTLSLAKKFPQQQQKAKISGLEKIIQNPLKAITQGFEFAKYNFHCDRT